MTLSGPDKIFMCRSQKKAYVSCFEDIAIIASSALEPIPNCLKIVIMRNIVECYICTKSAQHFSYVQQIANVDQGNFCKK